MRYLRILALAVALAATLKVFVADAVTVPTRSMDPAILPGDYVLLDKTGFSPSFLASRLPARGDVVAFELPASAAGDERGALALKRCIAVAGDTVGFREGAILVNGAVAVTGVSDAGAFFAGGTSRIVPRGGAAAAGDGDGPGGDQIFVIGDNHAVSLDSRAWGCIPARSVVGKAVMVYWSAGEDGVRWSRIGTLVR